MTFAKWSMPLFIFTTLVTSSLTRCRGDEPASSPNRFSLTSATGGGKQFWTDQVLYQDWRIQQNAFTGHSRFLNGENERETTGSFEKCWARLQQLVAAGDIEPMEGKVVILLHGIADVRTEMKEMKAHLRENSDYIVLNMSYASTRKQVADHANALASVVDHLGDGVEEVNLVGYSLGNLVIRHYWRDGTTDAETAEAATDATAEANTTRPPKKTPDPRIRRIVMLAPPNHGAQMAVRLGSNNGLYRFVLGESGRQLGESWDELEKRLGTPSCEFGIVAGCTSSQRLGSPLIDGPDDLIVGVEETRLSGASDFTILPVTHSTCPADARVLECTLRYLQHGYFHAADRRQPIP